MSDQELQHERGYVRSLYARLDELKAEAEQQLAAVRMLDVGGNHQSRSERDTFARIYEDRIVQLREVDERLAFGRIELRGRRSRRRTPVHRYIGRIGLRDDDQQPILLDWRVPQASAFYQATAATPLGARARRHLISKGREIVRIEDEIFDAELLDGDGVAACRARARCWRRSPRSAPGGCATSSRRSRPSRTASSARSCGGVLVVQGGPGTGKTAVALHRAAYLLYSHRERLRNSGVLIVGPSRSFLHYIEAVLPSLGETGVVLASVGQLFPGVDATDEDAPPTSPRSRARTEMAELIARAVRSRQSVPAEPQTLDVNGDTLMLEPAAHRERHARGARDAASRTTRPG